MKNLNFFEDQALRLPLPITYGHNEPFEIKMLNAENFSVSKPGQEQIGEIIWVTKGSFQLLLDMENYSVSEGMILLLAPGQAFYIGSAVGLEGFSVRFPLNVVWADSESPFPSGTFGTSRLFDVDTTTKMTLMRVFQCIGCELSTSQSQKTEVLSGYLRIVLIYLIRQQSTVLRTSFRADMATLAKKFFDLLERRYHVNKKVSEYADQLAVTPNYLNYVVKQETGKSVSANIRSRLLLQAKRMALLQDVNMKTVAYKLGFDDLAHFSKFFKMGCGCNFTTYRKRCPN